MVKEALVSKVKRKRRTVSVGMLYIKATFNNTMITITDIQGNVIAISSAGANGFKGAKKATPHAAQITAEKALDNIGKYGLTTISSIRVKGPGSQRDAALRSVLTEISKRRMTASKIEDCSGIPHNGPRPPKRRRT